MRQTQVVESVCSVEQSLSVRRRHQTRHNWKAELLGGQRDQTVNCGQIYMIQDNSDTPNEDNQ